MALLLDSTTEVQIQLQALVMDLNLQLVVELLTAISTEALARVFRQPATQTKPPLSTTTQPHLEVPQPAKITQQTTTGSSKS